VFNSKSILLSNINNSFVSAIFHFLDQFSSDASELVVPFDLGYGFDDFTVTIPKSGEKLRLLEMAETNAKFHAGELKRKKILEAHTPSADKTQLLEKHRALGQLASTTAGSYNDNGLLGGVLLKVNVGKYLNNEYAILNSISYDIPDDSSWDVDEQLAMYLKVNVSLTIIHNDLPQYKVPDVEGNEKAGFFGDLDNPIVRGYLIKQ
jgi:hypothetical protein